MAGRIVPTVHGPRHVGGRLAIPPRRAKLALTAKEFLRLSTLPTPPDRFSYAAAARVPLNRIYRNDAVGCCEISALQHLAGIWTGNSGNPDAALEFTDDQTDRTYSDVSGWNPSDPTTDVGCDPATASDHVVQAGLPLGRPTVKAWALIDAANLDEVRALVWLLEGATAGCGIPESWIHVGPGFTWDADTPVPTNGHAYALTGWDDGPEVSTWGMLGRMTQAAWTQNVVNDVNGTVIALLSHDVISRATLRAPTGFDFDALTAAFQALPRLI